MDDEIPDVGDFIIHEWPATVFDSPEPPRFGVPDTRSSGCIDDDGVRD